MGHQNNECNARINNNDDNDNNSIAYMQKTLNARTALPSPAEAAAASDPAAARNGLAEGTEQGEEEDEQVRLLSSSLTAGCSLRSPSGREVEPGEDRTIRYVRYESELQMPDIMRLITKDLSEPYSIYTYRYFIHNWPQLCFLAMVGEECVGAIVCKLDMHKKMFRRGYIAMLAVDSKYRRNGIGKKNIISQKNA
ncbi:hypothetical protein E2I00_014707 [Balaenoptera physalus]|uniref:N-acetyltransferase domain-containing protein n=1 Tax=Balaenoptera physalus TaxID=9770 RepID=A0A643CAI8_BALPH|nr:hypothetical protein E2I00_014707 [Balaenoptera physalus]